MPRYPLRLATPVETFWWQTLEPFFPLLGLVLVEQPHGTRQCVRKVLEQNAYMYEKNHGRAARKFTGGGAEIPATSTPCQCLLAGEVEKVF